MRRAALDAIIAKPEVPNEVYFNEDLLEFEPCQLLVERDRLRRRLSQEERPDEWFIERLRRVEALIARAVEKVRRDVA